MCVFVLLFYEGSVIHPFLLADNRHFPFYFWKNFLAKSELHRSYLAPILYTSALMVLHAFCSTIQSDRSRLDRQRACIRLFLVVVFGVAAAIPSPVLEFRYFLVPCILLSVAVRASVSAKVCLPWTAHCMLVSRQHCILFTPQDAIAWVGSAILLASITGGLLFLFASRPFFQHGQWQRFMW